MSNRATFSTPPVPGRLPYLPGLDGLRAFAVGAVLLYHAGLPWLPGGFLGVEVFFVISGYLITALLLTEWRQAGRLDLRGFWLRRARRLLPALYLVLVAVLAVFVVGLPGEVAAVRGDALAAFGYVTNWYFILRQQPYFEAIGRPSPLLHLWSLAIEEQFYLMWPPLLLVLLRRWSARVVALIALAGAVAAAGLMAALYQPGADPSRVYYGTDTRAAGLLLGAALALIWTPWRDRRRAGSAGAWLLDGAGLVALGLLIGLCVGLNEFQPALYRGGFALAGLATAVAIAAAVTPGARLFPALLEWAPLRWAGVRSYGLYLWHWPVFVLTRPQLDLPFDGPPLLALRLGATVLLAALSYRFVETPVRSGALARAWRAHWAVADGVRRAPVYLGSALSGAGAAGLAVLILAAASIPPPAPPPELAAGSVELTVQAPPAPPVATPRATTVPAPAGGDTAAGRPTPTARPAAGGGEVQAAAAPATVPAVPTASPTPAPVAAPPPVCAPVQLRGVTAIGDSVLVGAAEYLAERLGDETYISARLNRLPEQIPAVIRELRQAGQLGDIVIIHTGNNGYVIPEEFDLIMKELADTPVVFFVNVRVPRAWERPSNRELAAGVERYRNTLLIDWYGASAGQPAYFQGDGVHLTTAGRAAFATLLGEAVEAAKARWAQRIRCARGMRALPE
jgi:peptidoglycan/LPS O-acetylase OafA/YrhL